MEKSKEMRDILGRKIKVGDNIAYGLTVGRSANLAIYRVKEVTKSNIKAIKLVESYGPFSAKNTIAPGVPRRHMKWIWDEVLRQGEYVEMTQAEKDKVDNKTFVIGMPERAIILDEHTVQNIRTC